jgi:hypothetical protein
MSTTLRAVATAVVLTLLLAVSAVPADAQPRASERAAARIEANTLERLWQWVEHFWTPGGTMERSVLQGSVLTTTTSDPTTSGTNRGVSVDPNGSR